jgi:hypothetical protein
VKITVKIIVVTFKRNILSGRCYRDEEGNTHGPYAPYILRSSVPFSTLASALFSHLQRHSQAKMVFYMSKRLAESALLIASTVLSND